MPDTSRHKTVRSTGSAHDVSVYLRGRLPEEGQRLRSRAALLRHRMHEPTLGGDIARHSIPLLRPC